MNSTVPTAPAETTDPVQPPPPNKLKQALIFSVKLGLALGLLVYVAKYKVNQQGVDELKKLFSSPFILSAAIAAFSVQLLIGAQRLRILLWPQQVHLSYWTSLRLTYLGAFFDTFMITSVGGDAIKAVYLARVAPREHRVEAVSVLILDRLMGLIGLIALALTVAAWQFTKLQDSPETAWMIKWLLIVPLALLIGTAMLLSETVYQSSPMQFMLKYLPMGTMLSRAYGSLQKFRDRPGVLLRTFLLSTVVHFFGVLTGYILMLGMNKNAEMGPFFVSLLICNFICSFLPLGGIGGGQWVFDNVFIAVAGMKDGWVLATVLQAAILIAKAPGFVAWLLSREGSHPVPTPAASVDAAKIS